MVGFVISQMRHRFVAFCLKDDLVLKEQNFGEDESLEMDLM